jgi:small-conductance mechanosensitive channel
MTRLFLLACAVLVASTAQEADLVRIARARETAARDRSLTDAERKQILSMYDDALASLNQSLQLRASQLGQERRREALYKEVAVLNEQLLRSVPRPVEPEDPNETASAVEDAMERIFAERNAQARILNDISQASAELAKRREEVNIRRTGLRQDEESAQDQLTVMKVQFGSELWQAAALARATARRTAIDAEKNLLNTEMQALDALRQLMPLQRDATKLKLEAAERAIELWKQRVQKARVRDANRELRQASAIAVNAGRLSPTLQEASAQVLRLSNRLWGSKGVFLRKHDVAALVEHRKREVLLVDGVAASIKRRYEATQRFAPAREWLYGVPMDLPRLSLLEREEADQFAFLVEVRRESFQLDDARLNELTLESQMDRVREEWAKSGTSAPIAAEDDARRLLQLRRELTGELLKNCQELESQLVEYRDVSTKLMSKLREVRTFAEERILWARSAPDDISPGIAAEAVLWLFSGGVPASAWTAGLYGCVPLVLALLLMRHGLRDTSALNRFFVWPPVVLSHVRRDITWLTIALPVLWFLVGVLGSAGGLISQHALSQRYNDSLGRIAFLALFGCLLAAGVRLFQPSGPLSGYLMTLRKARERRDLLLDRLVLAAVLLIPLLLAISGFYATALLLTRNLFWTLVLTALTLIAFRLLDRRFARPDSPESNQQVRRASRFAIYLTWFFLATRIWAQVFPAAAMLRQVNLGSSPLTLLELLEAVLAVVLAIILIRNVPGVLEFLFLQRLRLHAGTIYAWSTITRYLLVLGGAMAVSRILGLNWSQVQWLAAALTFGVGFGLQEVFANMASGIILLLDRSIRVGDAVSVGEWSGRVSRIQMRATTVTLWNRSEMVVPNKEFISSKLINWTLSLPESRVDLHVGVAYGSDLEAVRQCLYDVAAGNQNALKDPPPEVLLTAFGDHAIQFELRAFCLFDFGRQTLLDELHSAVYREFAKRGIQLASPRLDVRLQDAPRRGT